jgi:hypothetical protein
LDRQKTLLVLVGVLALILVVRGFWPWLSRFDSAAAVASFGRSGDDLDAAAPKLKTLRLADLELKPAEYHPGRDPFRFARKPPPPPPVAARPAPQPAKKAPPKSVPNPAAQRQAVPQPPPVDVKYLGSFGPENRKIAVFGDGTDIYNVRKGDILKKHFLVESINYESADLKFVNFPKVPATRLAAGN